MRNEDIKEFLQEIAENLSEIRTAVNETKTQTDNLQNAVADMKIRIEKLTITGIEISFGGGKDGC